jgi:hypothetical protein
VEVQQEEEIKLRNRIMSWILSPGAFALWHSMGNPDEWKWDVDNSRLLNDRACLYVKVQLWWELAPTPLLVVPPFCFVLTPICWMLWPFIGFWCYNYEDGIGWFDRNVIAGRAMRLRTKLMKRDRVSKKQRQNSAIFTKLTVNQVAE